MGRIQDFAQQNSYDRFAPVIDQQKADIETPPSDRISALASQNEIIQEEDEESWPKWFVRTAMQIPKGIAQAKAWQADLFNAVAYGAATDPSEVYDLEKAHERAGLPFNEEEYLNAAGKIAQNFPTVGNLSRIAEEKTGIPLEAKDKFQKFIEFASTAGKLSPKGAAIRPFNTSLPRPVIGAAVAGTSQLGQALGIPEPIADIASFAITKTPAAGAGKISVGAKKKPSGLSERRFEDLKETKSVSEKTISKINENAEKEFRDITESIIEKTPLKDTRNKLKAEADFKANVSTQFEKVQDLANKMPGKVDPGFVFQNIKTEMQKIRPKGYALSEYESQLLKNVSDIRKDIFKNKLSTKDLVDQYRKNNKAFSQLTEPGKSFAYNQAKRDALLIHNKAIAEAIEQMHPNSEMANLFKETNEQWSKIMDSQAIDNYLNELFKGKVQFKKGKDFLDKSGVKEKFVKALGKEGTAQFETLVNDLMSYEQGIKFLKKAAVNGQAEIAKSLTYYMLHPILGKAKSLFSLGKFAYRTIYEAILKSPKIAITWDRAINAAKAGNYKAAQEGFKQVEDVIKTIHPDEVKKAEAGKPATRETINVKGEKIKRLTPDEILQRRKANRAARIGKDIEAKGKIIPETKRLEHLSLKPSEVRAREEIGMTPRLTRDSEAKGSVSPERRQLEYKENLPTRKEPAQIHQLESQQKQPRREAKRPIETPSVIEMALAPYLKEKPKLKRVTKEDLDHLMPKKKEKIKKSDAQINSEEMIAFNRKLNKATESFEKALEIQFKRNELTDKDIKFTQRNNSHPNRFRPHVKTSTIQKVRENNYKLGQEQKKLLEKAKESFGELNAEQEKLFEEMKDAYLQGSSQKMRYEARDNFTQSIRKQPKIEPKIEEKAVPKKVLTKVDTPREFKMKINNDIKRQDISSKGLAGQKEYLLHNIDKALADVANNAAKITFDVPGDGVFKILNNEKALQEFKKGVEKNWPKKAEPKFKVPEGYKKKPIGKPSTKAELAKKWQALQKDYDKLKNKIAKIGLAELGRERRFDESLREYIKEIMKKRSGKEIENLLNEYENFSLMAENISELHKNALD